MNSIKSSYIKALNPETTIKVTNLNNGEVPKEILLNIHQVLSYKYKTFLDEDYGVIYIGKRI